MFLNTEAGDLTMIFRGTLILVLVIVLGVAVAESQLNGLTQRQDFVQAFNIKHNHLGVYSTYILGCEYNVSATYFLGQISNTEYNILFIVNGHKLSIPTVISVESSKITNLVNRWITQFVGEAARTRYSLEELLRRIDFR